MTRYFRAKTDTTICKTGSIIALPADGIEKIYNAYGLYKKDEDDTLTPVEIDSHYYNADGRENLIVTGVTSSYTHEKAVTLYDENGSEVVIADADCEEGEAYIYWNGHNHAHIWVSGDFSEYEEVTEDMQEYHNAEQIEEKEAGVGKRLLLLSLGAQHYIEHCTFHQGKFNTIEKTEYSTLEEYTANEEYI